MMLVLVFNKKLLIFEKMFLKQLLPILIFVLKYETVL